MAKCGICSREVGWGEYSYGDDKILVCLGCTPNWESKKIKNKIDIENAKL
jgi:hypothetical protein